MQIVIDIPDGIYDFLVEHPDRQFPYATEWVRQGKPLPKGHGRLIDGDAIEIDLHNKAFNKAGSPKVYEIVWALKQVHNAHTILEADKEV